MVLGLTDTLMRWCESYLVGVDIGHIPISNLYEVSIFFMLITSPFYLYYEQRCKAWALRPFVALMVSTAAGSLLWCVVSRGAQEAQPLMPVLWSWRMEIHVPADFIGYGTFALSTMVGTTYLLRKRGVLASRPPSLEVLSDMMHKVITVGFAFLTIATVLGALWVADTWGGHWSWDPKKTWVLIVWLNYATWLYMCLVKGLRGRIAAWWALIDLSVTTFASLGVNTSLPGLHSYGELQAVSHKKLSEPE